MKNKLFVLLLVALVFIAAGFKYQASEPKWEYKIEEGNNDAKLETNYLTALGKQSWELVAVEGNGRERTYFLKRAMK